MKNIKCKIIIILAILMVNFEVFGAAFQLFEGNTQSVGDYGAGGGANNLDASATFYNPAALVKLPNSQFISAATLIYSHARFHGDITTEIKGPPASPPKTFHTETPQHVIAPIPAMYYATPVTDQLYFGVGITVPFGLSTEWPKDSPVRYAATKSALMAVNLGPVFAYKLTPTLSIGGGIDLQYLRVDLNSAVRDPLNDDGPDNFSQSKGDGFSYGWNVGLFYQAFNCARLGVHFRSPITHRLTGEGKLEGPSANPNPSTSTINSRVTLPSTLTTGVAIDLTDRWTVASTFYYTFWHSIKSLDINQAASIGAPIDVSIKQNFRNTGKIAVGTTYQMTDNWLVRAGVGYDLTSTNHHDRNLRLPDSDRIAFAIGCKYKFRSSNSIDIGYSYIKMFKTYINHAQDTGSQTTTTKGDAKGAAHLLSIQTTINFA